VDENSPREGVAVSLNLRLPSTQIAAQEHGPTALAAIKSSFDDLIEQLTKHKDHLRAQTKWIRRRRVGRTRPAPQVPFEETLAAVKPQQASEEDIQSYINANIRRLERFVDRELRFRANNGDLVRDAVTREEIIDEAVANALGDDQQKPDRVGIEAWLYRLAVRAIQQVARENRDGDGEMLPLEESMRQQNVRGSDEPQLQYHQPDEMITRETILRNPTVATPEEIAFSDEMISLVELSLAGMKREDQEAFVLDAIEGFTPEEIAAISDRPAEEVRESIRRARERLQKTLTVPDEFKDKLLQHTKTA
jgi:DNA-directed RNA polymerase specialized sigma24 family protein